MEFRLYGDVLKPLNVTEETCRFVGISRSEIDRMAEDGTSMNAFFAHCPLSSADIGRIINGRINETKDYTLVYGDGRTEKRSARLIACGVSSTDESSHYAIRYNIITPENRHASAAARKIKENDAEGRKIEIRTFGYFDIFVNGKPVPFKSSKAKELLAILVDRRGGYVTAGEAISYLWENEDANKVTLARYRKVAMRLKNELKENGIQDLVITSEGKRCINQKIVKCDLYDYLSDREKNSELFRGSYLLNYSWGEFTLSELQEI